MTIRRTFYICVPMPSGDTVTLTMFANDPDDMDLQYLFGAIDNHAIQCGIAAPTLNEQVIQEVSKKTTP